MNNIQTILSMAVTINAQTIITTAAVITAITTILSLIFACYRWYLKQNKQDKDIKSLKEEQSLLVYGILACLDGLEQLGCNHTVTKTRSDIEKHINKKAHEL